MKPIDALIGLPDPDESGEAAYRLVYEHACDVLGDTEDGIALAMEELVGVMGAAARILNWIRPLVGPDGFEREHLKWEDLYDNDAVPRGWSVFARDTPNEHGEFYEVQKIDTQDDAGLDQLDSDEEAWDTVFRDAEADAMLRPEVIAAYRAIEFLKLAAPRTLAAERAARAVAK